MITLLIFTMWLLPAIIGIRKNKKSCEGAFSLDHSLVLRGICAIGIVIGHSGIYLDDNVLKSFTQLDILFVGVFFALSGYGCMYSFRQKKDYLKHFILKKALYLIIASYVGHILATINMAITIRSIDSLSYLYDFREFFGDINWFIWELLIFYIVFYLVAKFTNISKTYHIIGIISFIFLIVGCLCHLEKNLYSCCLCFYVGIIYYYKKDRLNQILTDFSKKIIFLISSLLIAGLFIGGFVIIKSQDLLICAIVKNLACVSFVLVIIAFFLIFTIKSHIYKYIGTISLEIYIFNITVIGFCRDRINNIALCFVAIIVLNILVAAVMHKVIKLLKIK